MPVVREGLKGVILAGGLGTRLAPLTQVTSKHLLPVGNEPMVYHCLRQLTSAGITDILIVTNPEYVGDFVKVLGSGAAFGCDLTYRVQEEAKGIAHALALAEGFARVQRLVVYLGDNIFETSIQQAVCDFAVQPEGARVMLKSVADPERYGVATLNGNRQIVAIDEKPKHPKSRYAVVGVYFYDAAVFDIIRMIEPSARGEYEITAVNNVYLQRSQLEYSFVQGQWIDAGTFESLTEAHRMLLARA